MLSHGYLYTSTIWWSLLAASIAKSISSGIPVIVEGYHRAGPHPEHPSGVRCSSSKLRLIMIMAPLATVTRIRMLPCTAIQEGARGSLQPIGCQAVQPRDNPSANPLLSLNVTLYN